MDPITDTTEALAAVAEAETEANAIEEEQPESAERVSRIKLQTQRLRAWILTLE